VSDQSERREVGYLPRRKGSPRRIAVVPAYNEEPTVVAVLDELYCHVDELVVVDDGSTDNTRAEILGWLPGHDRCTLLTHDVNQGMSEAYYLALTTLRERLARGELDADDLVFTVDADGQHDLHVLDELVQMTIDEHLDANLARRDLSYHHAWKKSGNWVVSKWASLWAGSHLRDVESGYRIFRLGALAHALDYYSGYKYSETVEVAVVMCRLGYKVRNDHVVPVPVSRSRTSTKDAAIDMAVIPVAAGRVWKRDRAPEAFRTDAVAHLVIAAVLGLIVALTDVHATGGIATIGLAALAAFGLGALVRHMVPRPSLALLGFVIALVAAWLVPQRPDVGSAITLSAMFGVGAALAAPGIRRPRPTVLAAGFGTFVVVNVAGTRFALLALVVFTVFFAAVAARIGRIGMPRTHRLRSFAIGGSLVMLTSGITGYFGASTVGATWFGGGVLHGPRNEPEVALTFDDGPNITATPAIMAILDRAHVKATFFIVGKALDADPQIVRELYAHGHLLGNHSYHHDLWRWLDPSYPELERTEDAFARQLGGDACPVWFRPPRGQRTPMMARVVRHNGMRMAMWDDSVKDWSITDPQKIADIVLSKVRDGSIIDLHDGLDGKPWVDRSQLVKALPLILDGLRARHLKPVRLDQLLGGPAYQSCAKFQS
jgi:peptidoglycan/xylan/chitin deacetylase (PgdA/CDA1 family)